MSTAKDIATAAALTAAKLANGKTGVVVPLAAVAKAMGLAESELTRPLVAARIFWDDNRTGIRVPSARPARTN